MKVTRMVGAVVLTAAAAACGDGTGPGSDGTVSLSFTTLPGGSARSSAASACSTTRSRPAATFS